MLRTGVCVLAASVLVACGPSAAPARPTPAPVSLGWTDASSGRSIDLPTDHRISGDDSVPASGQPVLLNYWASTCGPCRKEMPLLQRLDDRGVFVVGVTRDRYRSFAERAIGKAGVQYANFQDFDETYTRSHLRGIVPTWAVPSSVLIVDGAIRSVHIGAFHSLADLRPVTALLTD